MSRYRIRVLKEFVGEVVHEELFEGTWLSFQSRLRAVREEPRFAYNHEVKWNRADSPPPPETDWDPAEEGCEEKREMDIFHRDRAKWRSQ